MCFSAMTEWVRIKLGVGYSYLKARLKVELSLFVTIEYRESSHTECTFSVSIGDSRKEDSSFGSNISSLIYEWSCLISLHSLVKRSESKLHSNEIKWDQSVTYRNSLHLLSKTSLTNSGEGWSSSRKLLAFKHYVWSEKNHLKRGEKSHQGSISSLLAFSHSVLSVHLLTE